MKKTTVLALVGATYYATAKLTTRRNVFTIQSVLTDAETQDILYRLLDAQAKRR